MKANNQVVLITGAGNGIGRTLALAYAGQGARTILIDKNKESLEQTAELIRSAGGLLMPLTYALDLSEAAQIESFFAWLREHTDRLDVLINNAGLGAWKSIYDLSVDEWDYVIHTNLRASFLCAKESAKLMRSNGGGSIVNIASTRALMSEPNSEAYAASKGGILSLTHALAASLGPDGIRVNAISPGWIENGDYSQLRPEDHSQHPAGRVGKPDDIARACMYLTDAGNDFVTGTNLVVDGGMTRKMIYIE
ncbi:SDR family NAD(P)-dependent oxidoreductase [Paenibacillus albus]|uniref:SDR family oxidoreductase n=1 Tax=Paenibacillus albus TaxID=2495582 RepID=A0A3S9A640_9BACL|nr:SDR family oxidoreductase [Paenibacillus albus]AZN41160.1 SDR family oxidoreductase [Paenibacillus albus]